MHGHGERGGCAHACMAMGRGGHARTYVPHTKVVAVLTALSTAGL